MPGIRLTYDDARLRRGLKSIRALLGPAGMAETLLIIGAKLEASTIRRFEDQAGPDGEKWEPSLAALGLAPRASGKISPGKTLIDTGRLRQSITSRVESDGLRVGTNVAYAAQHQFGEFGGIGARELPARPFLGLSDDDEEAIGVVIERRILGA